MLVASDCGLIVIDIQGKLARIVSGNKALIAKARALVLGCQALSLPILWLEQCPEKLGGTVSELAQVMPPDEAIRKTTFSGVLNAEFIHALTKANKTHWLVCGIEAHICVYQTAAMLLEQGIHITLIEDAISARSSANKQLALDKLKSLGAQLSSVEMCLYELLVDANHPQFKTVLHRIK